MRTSTSVLITLVIAGVLAGCDAPRPEGLPAGLDQINAIVNDESLTVQQKRSQLEDLGLNPLVINAILASERTGNQFGGDLRTAYDKVTGGHLNELTPDEVQIYGDEVEAVSANGTDFTFTDAQAQEIVDLFRANNIATSAELSAFLDDPASAAVLPADLTSAQLTRLFVDFDTTLLLPKLP